MGWGQRAPLRPMKWGLAGSAVGVRDDEKGYQPGLVGKLGQRGCEWGPTPGSLSAGGVCPPQLSRPITAAPPPCARVQLAILALITFSEPISTLGWFYLSRLPTVPPALEE